MTSNGLAQDHTVSVDNKVIMFFAKMDEIVKNEDIIGLREGYAPNAVVTFREKTGRGIRITSYNVCYTKLLRVPNESGSLRLHRAEPEEVQH